MYKVRLTTNRIGFFLKLFIFIRNQNYTTQYYLTTKKID